MIYADTDFILALVKEKDWLKKKAEEIYEKYKGHIFISSASLIELMLLAKKLNYDSLKIISFALSIGHLIDDESDYYFKACRYQKEYGLNVFDSIHISKCNGKIISSDKKFEDIPFVEVVKLG